MNSIVRCLFTSGHLTLADVKTSVCKHSLSLYLCVCMYVRTCVRTAVCVCKCVRSSVRISTYVCVCAHETMTGARSCGYMEGDSMYVCVCVCGCVYMRMCLSVVRLKKATMKS